VRFGAQGAAQDSGTKYAASRQGLTHRLPRTPELSPMVQGLGGCGQPSSCAPSQQAAAVKHRASSTHAVHGGQGKKCVCFALVPYDGGTLSEPFWPFPKTAELPIWTRSSAVSGTARIDEKACR